MQRMLTALALTGQLSAGCGLAEEAKLAVARPATCGTLATTAWFFDGCCAGRSMRRGKYECRDGAWKYVGGTGYCTPYACQQ